MHLNQIQFMLYHERDGKKQENASFVHIVYLLAKLCNICDEAFFIDVSIYISVYSEDYIRRLIRYMYLVFFNPVRVHYY